MGEVADNFFNRGHLEASFPAILDGFLINIRMMLVAEAAVLVWALLLVLMRVAPGARGLPLRVLAIVYIDFFRGVPLILVFFFVCFGLPIAGVPGFEGQSLFTLSVISLTLVYAAYVAEVYRAGIDSVHPSQSAAARSLGLSYGRTMRFVVLPQAVRRVIPPLLNDFVGLQKDTALAATVGLIEGANAAQIYAGTTLNVSSYVGIAVCFIVITIPLARLVDYLLVRDQRRMRAAMA